MLLSKAVKVALDETRLLILGAQVLLGFQFQAVFREGFETLSPLCKQLYLVALITLVVTIGSLIAPSMQHRIVEEGRGSMRLLGAARRYAMTALALLIVALTIDFFVVLKKDDRTALAMVAAGGFVAVCVMAWFVFPLLVGSIFGFPERTMDKRPPSTETRIEQMLTEARVILPGVQALLGFQFIVVFTDGFQHLPEAVRTTHYLALFANATAMALLMTPPALHRIAFGGEDDPRFLFLGSIFVVVAPVFLAGGLSADAYVALRAANALAPAGAVAIGLSLLLFLLVVWYGWPAFLRWYRRREITA